MGIEHEGLWPILATAWDLASARPTMLRTPAILVLGVLVTAVATVALHLAKKGGPGRYEGGAKAANTRYAKALPEYVSRRRKLRAAMTIIECCVIGSLVSSFALMARPSAVLTEEGDARKRDIFLCLDVSYSIFSQNEKLTDSLKDIVRGLDGERFGITLFNSSSVVYVPMTDDYDYVLGQLDALSEFFKMQAVIMQEEYMFYGEEPKFMPEVDPNLLQEYKDDPIAFQARMTEVDAGTTSGLERGSSIIGEGLATCLYSFPHLDDESRTRVIIMSTDNDPSAFQEDVSFAEAGELCSKHDVTVYGVLPSEEDLPMGHQTGYDQAMEEFDAICDGTGGRLYVAGSGKMDVGEAVSDIKSKEAIVVKEPSKRYRIDTPMLPYGLLVASVFLMLGVSVVMRPW